MAKTSSIYYTPPSPSLIVVIFRVSLRGPVPLFSSADSCTSNLTLGPLRNQCSSPFLLPQRFTHWYRLIVVRSEWSHRIWVTLLLLSMSICRVVLWPGRQLSRVPTYRCIQWHGIRSGQCVSVHCIQPGRSAIANVHTIHVSLQLGQLSVSMLRHNAIGHHHDYHQEGRQYPTVYARSLQHLGRSRR